jgi:hypothetical protein
VPQEVLRDSSNSNSNNNNNNASSSSILSNFTSFLSSWFHNTTVCIVLGMLVVLLNHPKDVANSALGHNQNIEDSEFVSFGFNVRLPEVNDIFTGWIQGLWFPPSDLVQTLALSPIESMALSRLL